MSLPRRPLCILAGKVDAVTEDLWPTTNKAGHVLNNNFSFSPFLIIKLKCFHLSVFVLHVLYFYHKHKRPITRYLSWSRQTWPRRDSQRSRGRLTEALGCVWGQADSRLHRVSDVGTRPHPAHDWQQGQTAETLFPGLLERWRSPW